MNPRLHKFASITGENWIVGRHLLPLLEELGASESGIVLDLACGSSPFRMYFPGASEYLRIDINPPDEGVARGSMLSIPLEDSRVDTILLFQAISDVLNPGDVLSEMRRVLKPGGRVLLFESMCYPEHDLPHDYYRIMPAALTALASTNELSVESLERLGGLFTRFSVLWNTFIMGGLSRFRLLRPMSMLGIVSANVFMYGLDRLYPRPSLASDYLAILRKTGH